MGHYALFDVISICYEYVVDEVHMPHNVVGKLYKPYNDGGTMLCKLLILGKVSHWLQMFALFIVSGIM